MKTIYLILILGLFTSKNNVYASDKILDSLKEGKKIIFIRHALAPGNGDPDNIDLNNCKTQRNLNKTGIDQSKRIGLFFKNNNIPIDKVLSSEWCRCKDTAKHAFRYFQTFKALNSFYDEKFYRFKKKQIKDLQKYINDWDGNKNLILVTHYVVISEMLNIGVSSGEIVISNKNYNIIGSIDTQ